MTAKGDPCEPCGGDGKVDVQPAPFGKIFPAEDREHVQTPVETVDCPVCDGTGKQK